jgi:hypothetical protein
MKEEGSIATCALEMLYCPLHFRLFYHKVEYLHTTSMNIPNLYSYLKIPTSGGRGLHIIFFSLFVLQNVVKSLAKGKYR